MVTVFRGLDMDLAISMHHMKSTLSLYNNIEMNQFQRYTTHPLAHSKAWE